LVELKIKLKEKMAGISKNGSEWLGLMREFIEVAADAAKIARAIFSFCEAKRICLILKI